MTIQRSFGWHPDISDRRDFKYAYVMSPQPAELPSMIDLRAKCSPVEDQGNLGSCTANAGVGLLEFLDNCGDTQFTNLSRLFLYYNTRILEGTTGWDSGATIRNTMKALYKYGVCAEYRMPYNVKNFKVKPTVTRYKEGLKRVIKGYYRLNSLYEIKASLAAGLPVVFGFAVYESFMSDEVAETGTAPMPGYSETMLGGHAVLAVGYDDTRESLIVRNSWGPAWGDAGYFYMPYKYVTEGIASDFWTIG